MFLRTKAPVAYSPYWLDVQFERVEQALTEFDTLRLVATHVEPARPREGDLRLADGSDWNPGSGAGFYGFYGGNWVKLG